jgi:hypothetical protein
MRSRISVPVALALGFLPASVAESQQIPNARLSCLPGLVFHERTMGDRWFWIASSTEPPVLPDSKRKHQ